MSAAQIIVRTYEVTVRGFELEPVKVSARTPSKARARVWRMYCSYDDSCDFRKFLSMSSLRRVPNPSGVGDRIIVGGLPATRVLGNGGQYVAFMRDGEDAILYSHPADVEPVRNGAVRLDSATDESK